MSIRFTDRELDIMTALWAHGPSTVREVRERIRDPIAYNTVQTILRILEDKGYVDHTGEGRAFRYRALVGREAAERSAIGRLVDTVFGGSAELLVAHLVRNRRLDRREIEQMRRLLDAAERGAPPSPEEA
jgi:predicted transcriptional regulator